MLQMIKNRLQAIEKVKRPVNVPELVMIYWDSSINCWIAKEQYVKRNSKGKIINRSGYTKAVLLDCPEEYKAPEGFGGKVLFEGELQ